MGRYQVGGSPQAIFVNGEQEALTLANVGGSTAYVDSNSSVNPFHSYPLLPNAVLTWEPDQPLWAVTEPFLQPTTLLITNNTDSGDPSRASSHTFVGRDITPGVAGTMRVFSSDGFTNDGIIETSPFTHLDVRVRLTTAGAAVILGSLLTIEVTWYSQNPLLPTASDTIIGFDRIHCPPNATTALSGATNNPVVARLPVKGAYATVFLKRPSGWSFVYCDIYGLIHRPQDHITVDWLSGGTAVVVPPVTTTIQVSDNVDIAVFNPYSIDSIALNQTFRKIRYGFHSSGAVTTAGQLRLVNHLSGATNNILYNLDIPVAPAATTFTSEQTIVPTTGALYIDAAPMPVAAGTQMLSVWGER